MTYQEILEQARACSGPYCKACPVCNGMACKNTVPGPGAKGIGTGAIRNYQKWQELCVNMDTICENTPVDTTAELFGRTFALPVFAAPVGAMTLHYGDKYDDLAYNEILVPACASAGIAAFTGDGVNPAVMEGAAQALRKILAKYAEVELLVQIGEYKKGADAEADFALGHIQAVNAFLRQGLEEKSSFEETLAALKKVVL